LVVADQSGGISSGTVAQPAKKTSAAQKKIPAGFNTPQLCGTKMRTQAVSAFTI
jgi:hypothetical protein